MRRPCRRPERGMVGIDDNRYAAERRRYPAPASRIGDSANWHPIKRLQQHQTVISPGLVDDRASSVSATGHAAAAGDVGVGSHHRIQTEPRAQPRHRHHIKQNLVEASDSSQSRNYDDAASISMTLDGDSLELVAQYADMASRDLDETDVEQLAGNSAGGGGGGGGNRSRGQAQSNYIDKRFNRMPLTQGNSGGGALELIEDDEDDHRGDGNYIEMIDDDRHLGLGFGGGGTSTRAHMRASSSTHSALTQTGSRDFD